jgi:cytosine deaminase
VLRTHVDIDPIVGLRGFNALLRVRERLRDTGRLQIVAFPQEGLGDDGYVEGLLDQALRAGADAVGGIPAREADPKAHIDRIFALAKKHGAPIDMHVDESDDPRDLTLEYLAEKTLAEGYAGRVVAGHCTSLAVAAEDDVARIVEKVKRAGITIVTLPSTNLHLGGRRDRGPVGRGLTPVRRLLAAGVNVVCGSDNIRDPFTPFGNARMLENGLLLAHAAHMGTGPELATIFEMATVRAASALGITGYGLDEGARADLVILDAESAADAVVSVAPPLWVIAGGKMLGSQYSSRLRLSRS